MIYSKEIYTGASSLSELKTGFGRSVELSFEEGMALNPTNLLSDYMTKNAVSNDQISKKEADELASDKNVTLDIKDGTYIGREAAKMMIERKYQSNKRAEYLENGPSGIAGLGASLTGNIAASFLDPIGMAANFIPFIPAARTASILAKTGGSMAARIGARAAIGAAEGIAGAAVLEPILAGTASDVGENYTLADSAMNLAIGGLFGGVIHTGLNLRSDIHEHFKANKLDAPNLKTDVEKLSTLERDEVFTASTSQVLNDSKINAEPILNIQKATKSIEVDRAMQIDPVAFRALDEARARVSEIDSRVESLKAEAPQGIQTSAQERITELETILSNQEIAPATGVDVAAIAKELDSLKSTQYESVIIKQDDQSIKRNAEIEALSKERELILKDNELRDRISTALDAAKNDVKNNPASGVVKHYDVDGEIHDYANGRGDLPTVERSKSAFKDIDVANESKLHNESFSDIKNSENYDKDSVDLINEKEKVLKENEKVTDAEKINLVSSELKQKLKAMNIDYDTFMEDFNKEIELARTNIKVAENLIPCVLGVK